MGSLQFKGLISVRTPTIHQSWMEVDDKGEEKLLSSESDESKPKSDVIVSDLEGVSVPGSEGSNECDDLPEKVMEPKWGCGRPSESVLLAITKSTKEPTTRRSRVVPSASEESCISLWTCGLASYDRLEYDSKSEGKPRLGEPKVAKTSQYDEPKRKSAIGNSTRAQQG